MNEEEYDGQRTGFIKSIAMIWEAEPTSTIPAQIIEENSILLSNLRYFLLHACGKDQNHYLTNLPDGSMPVAAAAFEFYQEFLEAGTWTKPAAKLWWNTIGEKLTQQAAPSSESTE